MRWKTSLFIAGVLFVSVHPLPALAAPAGSFPCTSDRVAQVQSSEGKILTCGLKPSTNTWVPGIFKSSGGYFLPTSQQVKVANANYKNAPSSRRAKLKKKLTALKVLLREGIQLCSALQIPNITPTQSPTVCFDSAGNTSCFGIAPGTGNRSAGYSVQSFFCNGCHIERRNSSYERVQLALSTISDMSFLRSALTQQQIRDIVAYLNSTQP